MYLRQLFELAGYDLPAHITDREVTGISSDSRTLKKGNIFVAIQGLSSDGASFVGAALARGASFVVCERGLEGNCNRFAIIFS